jgi:argininosuccinate lyase
MKLDYLKQEIEVKQEKINEALHYIEMLEEESYVGQAEKENLEEDLNVILKELGMKGV